MVESYEILLITSESDYTIEESNGIVKLKVGSVPVIGDETIQIKVIAFGGASLETTIEIEFFGDSSE
jgi:hypothetical protein